MANSNECKEMKKALSNDKSISHREGNQQHVNHKNDPHYTENTFKSNTYEVFRRQKEQV